MNSPVAVYQDELYNMPFNMNTFSKLWGIKTPAEAKAKIEEQKRLEAEKAEKARQLKAEKEAEKLAKKNK